MSDDAIDEDGINRTSFNPSQSEESDSSSTSTDEINCGMCDLKKRFIKKLFTVSVCCVTPLLKPKKN